MKKGIILLLCVLMLTGSAFAETMVLNTPFQDVELTLEAPTNTTLEQSIDNELAIIHVAYEQEGTADYHILLAKSDLEGVEGRSMTDLSDEEIAQIASASAGEMEEYTYYTKLLDNGMKIIVLDEAGDTDEHVSVFTLVQGYLLGVRSDYHGTDQTMTENDYQNTVDLLGSMTLTVK